MRSLVCITPGEFEYKEVEIPSSKAGHSLLRISRIGICGTDLHAFEGTQPFFNYPRILGHELAAEYVSGDAEGFDTHFTAFGAYEISKIIVKGIKENVPALAKFFKQNTPDFDPAKPDNFSSFYWPNSPSMASVKPDGN